MSSQVAPKNINILSRDVIKRNGVILYTLLSSDGINKYFATYQHGKATCECKGFEYHNTCRHAKYIVEVEQTASFDIVGECLNIFNQATIDAQIGNHYEVVGAIHQARQAELGSCDTCGYPVKPGFTTCSKCAGY